MEVRNKLFLLSTLTCLALSSTVPVIQTEAKLLGNEESSIAFDAEDNSERTTLQNSFLSDDQDKQPQLGSVINGGDTTYDLHDEFGNIKPEWKQSSRGAAFKPTGEIQLSQKVSIQYTFGFNLNMSTDTSGRIGSSLVPSVYLIDKDSDTRPVDGINGTRVQAFHSLLNRNATLTSSSPLVMGVSNRSSEAFYQSTAAVSEFLEDENAITTMVKSLSYYYQDLPDGKRIIKQVGYVYPTVYTTDTAGKTTTKKLTILCETTMIPERKRVRIERKITNKSLETYKGFILGAVMDTALFDDSALGDQVPIYYLGKDQGLYIERQMGLDKQGKEYGYRQDFYFTGDSSYDNWCAGSYKDINYPGRLFQSSGANNRFTSFSDIGQETSNALKGTNALSDDLQQYRDRDTAIYMKTQPVDLSINSYIRASYSQGIGLMERVPEIVFDQKENTQGSITYYNNSYVMDGSVIDQNDDRTKLELTYSVDGGEAIRIDSWDLPLTDVEHQKNGTEVERVEESWSVDLSRHLEDGKDHTLTLHVTNGVTESEETVVLKYNRTPELSVNSKNNSLHDGSKIIDGKYPIFIDYQDEDSADLILRYEVLPIDELENFGEARTGSIDLLLPNDPLNTLHKEYAAMIPDSDLQSKKQRIRFWIEDKDRMTDKESSTAYLDIEREPKPELEVDLNVAKSSILQGTANSYTATIKTSGDPEASFHDPKLVTDTFEPRVTPDLKSVKVTIDGKETTNVAKNFDSQTRQLTVSLNDYAGVKPGLGVGHEVVIMYDVTTTATSASSVPIEQSVAFAGSSSKVQYTKDKSEMTSFLIVEKMGIVVSYFAIDPATGKYELQEELTEVLDGDVGEEIESIAKKISGYILSDTKIDNESIGVVEKPKVKIGTNQTLDFYYDGSLEFSSVPTVIDFGNQAISSKNKLFDNPGYDKPLVVYDNRSITTGWKIMLKQSGNLLIPEEPSMQLIDALSYQTSGENKILSIEKQEVFQSQTAGHGKFDVSTETWGPDKEGLRLNIPAGSVKQIGSYETTLTWTIEEVY